MDIIIKEERQITDSSEHGKCMTLHAHIQVLMLKGFFITLMVPVNYVSPHVSSDLNGFAAPQALGISQTQISLVYSGSFWPEVISECLEVERNGDSWDMCHKEICLDIDCILILRYSLQFYTMNDFKQAVFDNACVIWIKIAEAYEKSDKEIASTNICVFSALYLATVQCIEFRSILWIEL